MFLITEKNNVSKCYTVLFYAVSFILTLSLLFFFFRATHLDIFYYHKFYPKFFIIQWILVVILLNLNFDNASSLKSLYPALAEPVTIVSSSIKFRWKGPKYNMGIQNTGSGGCYLESEKIIHTLILPYIV